MTLQQLGYGMSETSGAIFTDPVGTYKYGSIGKPVPNTEAKVFFQFIINKYNFCVLFNRMINYYKLRVSWNFKPMVFTVDS